jgi:DnaK suppressor protein
MTTLLLIDGVVPFSPYKSANNEDYMNDSQQQHFETILCAWKTKLLQEAGSTLDGMRQKRENYADEVDLAVHEENFRLELRARDRERKLIKKIDQSLADIKIGEYGYCDDCGSEIGIPRLEARPTATKCIECKTVSELKEKQLVDA